MAIVNYIITAIIVIYVFRKCWLGCCNIRVVTKKPKRYQYYRYPCNQNILSFSSYRNIEGNIFIWFINTSILYFKRNFIHSISMFRKKGFQIYLTY